MPTNTRGKELVSITYLCFSICQNLPKVSIFPFLPTHLFVFAWLILTEHCWGILLTGQVKGPMDLCILNITEYFTCSADEMDWTGRFWAVELMLTVLSFIRCCSYLTLTEVVRLGCLVSQHFSLSLREKTPSFFPIKHSGGEGEWMRIFFVLLALFDFAEILKHPLQQGQECRWFLSSLLGTRESLFLFLCLNLSLFLFSITTWKKKF